LCAQRTALVTRSYYRKRSFTMRRRGLAIAPELAVADGALGFWQAIEEVWPKTRGQRCWVHYADFRIMPRQCTSPFKRCFAGGTISA
jgi:transposase-like protein